MHHSILLGALSKRDFFSWLIYMTYFIFQMQITVTSELIEGNEFTIVVNASAYESLKHKFQLHVPVTSDTNVLKNISGEY